VRLDWPTLFVLVVIALIVLAASDEWRDRP
jgi:hypothetical protein